MMAFETKITSNRSRLENLREEFRIAEEYQKLRSELVAHEAMVRKINIDILENGSLEDKVNLLTSKYLAQLKFEQEREDDTWKKMIEQLGIEAGKNHG